MDDQPFVPDAKLATLHPEAAVGGYTRLDGQVEFDTRINALLDETSRALTPPSSLPR